MRMSPVNVTLSDGRSAVIRSAEANDAAAVRQHLISAARQTPYLLKTADEYSRLTRREQAALLKSRAKADGAIIICAFVGDALAGLATVSPYGRLFRTSHRGTMSISIDRSLWGLGLGKAMMAEIISFSAFCGYTQLELSVDAENKRAIGLYERFGFVRCGHIPSALRQEDGSFHDEIMMIKIPH